MKEKVMIWALFLFMGISTIDAQSPLVQTRKIGSMEVRQGAPNVPVILVQFADKAMSEAEARAAYEHRLCRPATQAEVERGEGSAYQYFVDQSAGKFTPDFVVMGPVTLSRESAHYGADGAIRDVNMHAMISEALMLAYESEQGVEWTSFDKDHDGVSDGLYVIYAGEGQHAYPDQSSLLWPSTFSFSEAGVTCPEVGGIRFDGYSCCNELLYGKVDGFGTFCHEFSHQIGLPDFYRTDGANTSEFAMGNWSLMDRGGYEMDGYRPVGLRALEKAYLGWLDLTELTQATSVKDMRSTDEGGMAFKVVNKRDAGEYYILEVIDDKGWNKSCRGKGLLVSHIYLPDYTSWNNNTVNNCMPFRVTVIPADNAKPKLISGENEEAYDSSLYGDTYPANGNDELTNTSLPAAIVQVGGLSGKTMNKPITGITYDELTQTVSFDFMGGSEENVISSLLPPGVDGSTKEWYRLDGTKLVGTPKKGVYILKSIKGESKLICR